MVPNAQSPHAGKGLLAALPKSEFAQLSPHLQIVKLHFKDILTEAGEPVREAYFPHALASAACSGTMSPCSVVLCRSRARHRASI
jgi:hypothetical protein